MSYDLMVFEPSVAPRDRAQFMEWYHQQTQWSEGHGYNDPAVASPALQRWFQDMISCIRRSTVRSLPMITTIQN